MNRLYPAFKNRSNNRFHFLIGSGISDLFVTNSENYESILFAINPVLHDVGFDRIIHASPMNVVRCLDNESKSNSENILWRDRDQILNSGIVEGISTGPFGVTQKHNSPNNKKSKESGLGDIHGIRILDELMKDVHSLNTACVIYDAITFVNHIEAPRILLGILNEWLLLPRENHNECFFVVPVESYKAMEEQIIGNSLSQFLMQDNVDHNYSNVIQIGYPNAFEIESALSSSIRDQYRSENEIQKIVRICLSEDEPLRTWIDRFHLIIDLTIQEFRQFGWIRSSSADPRSVEDKLNDFVGLDDIKDYICLIQGYAKYLAGSSENEKPKSFHSVFFGNPGTGKTSIARLFGQIFQENGLLRKGHFVEVKGSDLIADHVGGTGLRTNEVIDRALDGVLFIDEAYSLSGEDRGGFGKEAIEVIIKRMEDDRDRLVVILAGYKEEMIHFLKINPGLDRRFPKVNRIEFPDFSEEELKKILFIELKNRRMEWDEHISLLLGDIVADLYKKRGKNFGNAGEIRNLAESIEMLVKARIGNRETSHLEIIQSDIPDVYHSVIHVNDLTIEDIMAPLDKYIGMDLIKQHILSISKVIRLDTIKDNNHNIQRNRYLEHYLFLGNPGTGKTTTAKVLGEILFNLGILRTRNVVEVTAVDLIAGYVGQTPEKTRRIIEKAVNGILFIDEAYTLLPSVQSGENGFGREVIDTLVKSIEEQKDQLVVIMAGYPEAMIEMVRSNPGLNSRFTKIINFPDFTPEQLREIFIRLCNNDNYIIYDDVLDQVVDILQQVKLYSPKSFGNAREVKRLYRHMVQNLANRIVIDPVNKIIQADLPNNWNEFFIQDVDGYEIILDKNLTEENNIQFLLRDQPIKKNKRKKEL